MAQIEVKIDLITSYLLESILEYTRNMAINAMQEDIFKDNNYIITACNEVLEAIDKARKEIR